MTIRDKYQIVESLVPLLDAEDWKNIVYCLDEHYSPIIIKIMVSYMAANKKDELASAWPCGQDVLAKCAGADTGHGYYWPLAQDEVDALLRGAEDVD